MKKKVAIIGTNGIPAKYGGFETLVENLTKNLNAKFNFTVYCSSIYSQNERKKSYNGAKLIYLPLKANGFQSLAYDILSYVHASFFSKTILFLGPTPSGVVTFLNFFFNRNILINHGGLNEWEREKYSNSEKKWARLNHFIAARNAVVNITDNTILQKSLQSSFNTDSVVIRYGGDHCKLVDKKKDIEKKYDFLDREYYLCVARAQVDNNLHLLLDTFNDEDGRPPLVIISNWDISDYGKELKRKYSEKSNLILLDAIYDVDVLNYIRQNCHVYIHSHSYCGTAPSLVEAMNLNVPIICFDVPTNRETTKNKAYYFKDKEELKHLVNSLAPEDLQRTKFSLFSIAKEEYTWENISNEYSKIF